MLNGYLRQSTAAQSRMVGPFVDDTDFKTLATGLTIANTDVKLCKNGAASVNKNSGGGTHRVNANYAITFDATDTDTVGELHVSIVVAGALIVVGKFVVLEEAVYDALYVAAAVGFATPAQVNAEVLDALAVDTHAQPAQGAPAATTSYGLMLRYCYKFLRNRVDSDGDSIDVYADDDVTVDHRATQQDVSGTYTRGKFGTGA